MRQGVAKLRLCRIYTGSSPDSTFPGRYTAAESGTNYYSLLTIDPLVTNCADQTH